MPDRTIEGNYRYAYQGQEKDPETGMEAFELRLWDARIGRWLRPDPYGQFFSPYLGMGNNPISLIDGDGGLAKPFDIIIRSKNPVTGKWQVDHIIKSKIYNVTFDMHFPTRIASAPLYPVSQAPSSPEIHYGFDTMAKLIGKPDALKVTVTADAAVAAGIGGSFDLVAFLNGPDKGTIYSYITDFDHDTVVDINFGLGGGVSYEFGAIYSKVDLRNFNHFTLEGPEITATGSYGWFAASIFHALDSGNNGKGYKTGEGPYWGFSMGLSAGTPASIMGTISFSKLYDSNPIFTELPENYGDPDFNKY